MFNPFVSLTSLPIYSCRFIIEIFFSKSLDWKLCNLAWLHYYQETHYVQTCSILEIKLLVGTNYRNSPHACIPINYVTELVLLDFKFSRKMYTMFKRGLINMLSNIKCNKYFLSYVSTIEFVDIFGKMKHYIQCELMELCSIIIIIETIQPPLIVFVKSLNTKGIPAF